MSINPYDILITLGLGISIGLFFLCLFFKKSILSGIFIISGTLLVWGSFIEPRILTTTHVDVVLTKNITEFDIAVLSDLHAGPYNTQAFFERVIEKTIALDPDIVVILGDHISNNRYSLPNEIGQLSVLKKLTEKYPVYAVHGNHDYGIEGGVDLSDQTKKIMQSYGITYLQNETITAEINGQRVHIFGGDEVWAGKLDYHSLTEIQRDPIVPTIALIHNPAYLYLPHPNEIDLTLSGHTHGGQIRLPALGPIGRVDSLIPTKLYQGLHEPEREGEYLFVTRGVGQSEMRARLFAPPEIVLLTISGRVR
jgi:predicted MPP superfamily phosphohydrolase